MTTIHPIVHLCLTCFFIISCHSRIELQLDSVERMLDNHPDSALFILSQIDTSTIIQNGIKAHYALLKSAALDKNYIDIKNDSLISVAKSYYQKHGSQFNKMRSLYYYGIIKMNSKDYPSAAVSFDASSKMALSIGDLRYLGLSHRNLGRVFNSTNNFAEAKRHNKKAIIAFENNNDTSYADYAKYALAINYINENQMDSCRLLLKELRNNNRIPSLKYYASAYYANTLVSKGDSLDKAIEIYRTIPRKYLSPFHYGYCAKAFARLSQLDSARKWMNNGYKEAKSKADSASLHSFVYTIDLLDGKPDIALAKVTKAMAVQDSLTRQILLQSLSLAQKDYYQQEAAIQETRAQKQMILLIMGGIIFMLVLLSTVLFMTKKHNEKEAKFKEQIAQLALLYNNAQKDKGTIVGDLFLERIARLAGLSGNYFFCDEISEQSKALDLIKKKTREIKNNPSLFSELEDTLNNRCQGVMNKLTAQVPTIKGENRTIISLFFAGIPDRIIQLLMGRISTGSLKTLRSRFRSIIKDAHPADEELFLKMLKTEKRSDKKSFKDN